MASVFRHIGVLQILIISFIIFLFSYPASSDAQISGQVIGSDGIPVNYATVFNLSSQTGCITDSVGFFNLIASFSDSIRVQHLSYKTGNFGLGKNLDQYKLDRNLNEIKEITVSKLYAGWLAVRSGEKAISRMQHEPRDRMYCNAVRTLNKDTLDQIFTDLDFERNKTGNGLINNRFIEIQRYCQQLNHDMDPFPEQVLGSYLFPLKGLPVIKEEKDNEKAMNDDCVFCISTDSQFIRVSLIPKKEAPLYRPVFELTISKLDTCLVGFAMATYPSTSNPSKKLENKPEKSDNAFFYQISFENGLGYISRIYSELNLYGIKDNNKYANKFTFNLNNYAHSSEKLKKRSGKWIINNIFGFVNKPKSKYSEEFWKKEGFPYEAPYDFIKLRALKQNISDQN